MKLQQVQAALKIDNENIDDLRQALQGLGAIKGEEVLPEVDLGNGPVKTLQLLQTLIRNGEGTLLEKVTTLLEQATQTNTQQATGYLQQVYQKIDETMKHMAGHAAKRAADTFAHEVMAMLTGSTSEQVSVEGLNFLQQLQAMEEGSQEFANNFAEQEVTSYSLKLPQSQDPNQKRLKGS